MGTTFLQWEVSAIYAQAEYAAGYATPIKAAEAQLNRRAETRNGGFSNSDDRAFQN